MQRTYDELHKQAHNLGIVGSGEMPTKDELIRRLREHFQQANDLPYLGKLKLADLNDLSSEEQDQIWTSERWIVEPKHNGIRCRAYQIGGRLRFSSVVISTQNFNYSEIRCLSQLKVDLPEGSIIEGELVSDVDHIETGKTRTENRLQVVTALTSMTPSEAIRIQNDQQVHLKFKAFDILHHDGKLLMNEPLHLRRRHLERIRGNNFFTITMPATGNKRQFYEDMIAANQEGVVLKNIDAIYQATGRPKDCWLKKKTSISIDARVSGVFSSKKQSIAGLEFSVNRNGQPFMIARVASIPDEMKVKIKMGDSPLGQIAELTGMALSPKSGRIIHARISRWRDGTDSKDPDDCE